MLVKNLIDMWFLFYMFSYNVIGIQLIWEKMDWVRGEKMLKVAGHKISLLWN